VFDFRYHALSLVAVFLALAVGLLLGVAIGDRGLVSSARENLQQALRGDVQKARAQASELATEQAHRQVYEQRTYPLVVDGRLDGRRVGLVFLGGRSDQVFRKVQTALQPSGGDLAFTTTIRRPIDGAALAAKVDPRFAGLADMDGDALEAFGRKVGEELLQGGSMIRDLRSELLSDTSGSLDGAESIVVYRAEPGDAADGQATGADRFERGLVEGLRSFQTPVVGVEMRDTDPSQIGWYQGSGLSTVDDVDDSSGMASLVVCLADTAEGSYGEKDSADTLVPDALSPTQSMGDRGP
jgi:hypothetical protein